MKKILITIGILFSFTLVAQNSSKEKFDMDGITYTCQSVEYDDDNDIVTINNAENFVVGTLTIFGADKITYNLQTKRVKALGWINVEYAGPTKMVEDKTNEHRLEFRVGDENLYLWNFM